MKSMDSEIEELLDTFSMNVDGLMKSMPLVMRGVSEKQNEALNNLREFLKKEIPDADSQKKITIPPEKRFEFDKVEKEYLNARVANEAVPRSLFVTLVSFLDGLIKELLRVAVRVDANLILSTEKSISIAEVFQINSIEGVREHFVEREIAQLVAGGRLAIFNWMENRLKARLLLKDFFKKRLTEITERRNLFTHSGGRVDQKYLNICERAGFKKSELPKVGEEVPMSSAYFYKSCVSIHIIGLQIGYAIWRVLTKELEGFDQHLINTSADLLNDSNNAVAGALLAFIIEHGAHSSDELRRMFIINHALSLKYGGHRKEAIASIKDYDWSAVGERFKLAVAVICDKKEEALRLMHQIGADDEMRLAYRCDWPLFKELRVDQDFRKVFKDIFGEELLRTSNPGLA